MHLSWSVLTCNYMDTFTLKVEDTRDNLTCLLLMLLMLWVQRIRVSTKGHLLGFPHVGNQQRAVQSCIAQDPGPPLLTNANNREKIRMDRKQIREHIDKQMDWKQSSIIMSNSEEREIIRHTQQVNDDTADAVREQGNNSCRCRNQQLEQY